MESHSGTIFLGGGSHIEDANFINSELKQITPEGKLVKDWDQVPDCLNKHSQIRSIIVVDKFLFVSDYSGSLKKFSIQDQKLKHNFLKIHDFEIHAITCGDGENIFTTDDEGNMKQFSVSKSKLIRSYEGIMESSIFSISVTGNYLFLSDFLGYVKYFDIAKQEIYFNMEQIHPKKIGAIHSEGET